MGETIERFPLFPLGLVLLPGEHVPLHIFEERYKQMIGECLDEEREFGILWLADDALKDVGCTARITRVLERFEDGRINILVEGTTPFRLERRIGDLPYPAGDIELLDDEAGTDEAALERARTSYADLVEQVTDDAPGARGARRARRVRHGRHARHRGLRQAGAARAALGAAPASSSSRRSSTRPSSASERPTRVAEQAQRQRPPEAGRVARFRRLAGLGPGDGWNMRRGILGAICLLVITAAFSATAQAARYDTHTAIVKLKSGVSTAERLALFDSAGVTARSGPSPVSAPMWCASAAIRPWSLAG